MFVLFLSFHVEAGSWAIVFLSLTHPLSTVPSGPMHLVADGEVSFF